MVKGKFDFVGYSYDVVMKYKGKVEKVRKDLFFIYKVDCEE